jgi:hypothetical protein
VISPVPTEIAAKILALTIELASRSVTRSESFGVQYIGKIVCENLRDAGTKKCREIEPLS